MKEFCEKFIERLKVLGCTESEVAIFALYFERWSEYISQYGKSGASQYIGLELEEVEVELLQLERAGAISKRQRDTLYASVCKEVT